MWAVIIAGILFGASLTREFFPETRPNRVIITAPYPGASPDEVETSIATKIEDALSSLDDVKELSSTVVEGAATIVVEFEDGVDVDTAVADVKREVDALQDFPDAAERIIVGKLEPNLPVIVLSIFGEAPERDLKQSILEIRDDLRSLPGMGDVVISGVRTDEIRVEVDPAKLVEHELSIAGVADRVRQAMIELPGGSVRSGTTTIAVRTIGALERADEVRDIVVKAGDGGFVLRLRDIATVSQTFADIDLKERLNGHPSASVTILKVGDQDAVDLADNVKAYAAGLRGDAFEPRRGERISMALRRPGSTEPISDRHRAWELGLRRAEQSPLPGEVALTTDLARFIVGRLDLLTRNAISGAILVFVTLTLFLNLRVSFWVTGGMVVSILGTLAAMHFAGVTLNLLSMFGLIIVVGLLVDDAIVVAENITTKHDQGMAPDEAAIAGAEEVGWPVVGTVLTTIFAFLPLAMLDGQTGDFLAQLPMVAACALTVSLFEALFVLPRHMAMTLRKQDEEARRGKRSLASALEARFDVAREAFFHNRLEPGYARMLAWCLRRRWLTLAISFSILIVSLGMLGGGRLGFVFLDSSDAETVTAELRMPVGTPLAETDRLAKIAERAAMEQAEVRSIFALVGSISSLNGEGGSAQQTHLAQLIMELAPVEERERTSEEVIVAMRKSMGDLPGVKSLRIQGMVGGPGGTDITLTVSGDDEDRLVAVSREIQAALAEYDGVYDIADDADRGQRELRIRLRPGASELGLTTESVARQVRASVFGLEAHTFPGRLEDVDVRVTLPEATRRSVSAIESMRIFTPTGVSVPLVEVCTIEDTEGYATVRRLDGKRAVTVSADVDSAVANTERIMGRLRPTLRALEASNPGVRVVERGRQQDMAESFARLPLGMLVALGLIYVCLAWLFANLVQPILVMLVIPFSLIGVVWGHLVMGYNMTFLSMIGFVALSGVVVNDSLVYIEFYNHERKRGVPILQALLNSGRNRLRAIILTTITTAAGLAPIMLEQSFQARFLIPMAITISFGLVSATTVVLVALPCLIATIDDVSRGARSILWGERRPAPADPVWRTGEVPQIGASERLNA